MSSALPQTPFHFARRTDVPRVKNMAALVMASEDATCEIYPRSVIEKPASGMRRGNYALLNPALQERFSEPNKAPPVHLSKYHNAFLLGDSIVVSSAGKIAKDCVLNNRYFNERGMVFGPKGIESIRPADGPVEVIEEPCFFLSASGLLTAYTHWFTEIMTRLAPWFAMPEPRPKILLDDGLLGYQREMLHKLGITDDQIILKNSRKHYHARLIYVPGALGTVWLHTECFGVYRRLAKSCDMDNVRAEYRAPMPRICLHRVALKSRRSLINLEALYADLEAEGYHPIIPEQMNLDEKLHVFGQATHVVGEAGGGMTNLVFARAGTKALVLSSDAFPSPIFTNITSALGHECHYVVGTSVEHSTDRHDNNANFIVAPSVFREALGGFHADNHPTEHVA